MWTGFSTQVLYHCSTEQATQVSALHSKQSSGTVAGIQTLQSDHAMSASTLVYTRSFC